MYIDLIEDRDAFNRLKENWDEVYDADPPATLFLSWSWLSAWQENLATPWIVLAAKKSGSDARYVAFFRFGSTPGSTGRGVFPTILEMAGSHAADYCGLISIPKPMRLLRLRNRSSA